MSTAYSKLLNEVCVRLGFCGSVLNDQPLHVDQFLPRSGPVSSEAFAVAVFKAEGWDPEGPRAHEFRAAVREAFVRHMGMAEVDAQLLA
jgi:hypothetical protein